LFLVVGVWALANGRGHGFSVTPLFHRATFSWSVVFAGVSIGVLSFLGFDGIAMLSEEARGGTGSVGRAMKVALVLAGVLFVVQVWVAALLVPDPNGLLANGDPGGSAFYDAAGVAGGHWLSQLTSTATAVAWGVGDTMVAQVAVIRLLYAMGRDRQLPGFLARVSIKRSVPANATLVIAVVSAGLGLWMAHRGDGISLLSSMINMGALIAFFILHACVITHYVIRRHSRDLWRHLFAPLIGAGLLVLVVVNAHVLAQRVGAAWIGIGLLVLAGLYVAGRRPELAGMTPPAAGAVAGGEEMSRR
jgi:amino acid transporter